MLDSMLLPYLVTLFTTVKEEIENFCDRNGERVNESGQRSSDVTKIQEIEKTVTYGKSVSNKRDTAVDRQIEEERQRESETIPYIFNLFPKFQYVCCLGIVKLDNLDN